MNIDSFSESYLAQQQEAQEERYFAYVLNDAGTDSELVDVRTLSKSRLKDLAIEAAIAGDTAFVDVCAELLGEENGEEELVSTLEAGIDELSIDLMYIHQLVHAWCDAVDAEVHAAYGDLSKAIADRNDAEEYLRRAVGR
jgi:hypothetical protein